MFHCISLQCSLTHKTTCDCCKSVLMPVTNGLWMQNLAAFALINDYTFWLMSIRADPSLFLRPLFVEYLFLNPRPHESLPPHQPRHYVITNYACPHPIIASCLTLDQLHFEPFNEDKLRHYNQDCLTYPEYTVLSLRR